LRLTKASTAGTGTGARGRGARSGVAGDGDAWGPDDRTADAPPSRFGEGGDHCVPVDGNGSNGRD
jgi:hypothetical protein